MSYSDRLKEEINDVLTTLEVDRSPWEASWIAHEVCNQHRKGLAKNDERFFWDHCGYTEARRQVRECINRRAGDHTDLEAVDRQYVIPGYEHLRSYYVVERDGQKVGVSVYDTTDDDLDVKKTIYRSMGQACYAHADEIDRFQRDRRAKRVG